jgi:uncharacterized membrane protein YesL
MNDYNSMLFIITTIILFISVSYFFLVIVFHFTSVFSGNKFKNAFKVSFIAPFIHKPTRTIFIFLIIVMLVLLFLGLVSLFI